MSLKPIASPRVLPGPIRQYGPLSKMTGRPGRPRTRPSRAISACDIGHAGFIRSAQPRRYRFLDQEGAPRARSSTDSRPGDTLALTRRVRKMTSDFPDDAVSCLSEGQAGCLLARVASRNHVLRGRLVAHTDAFAHIPNRHSGSRNSNPDHAVFSRQAAAFGMVQPLGGRPITHPYVHAVERQRQPGTEHPILHLLG